MVSQLWLARLGGNSLFLYLTCFTDFSAQLFISGEFSDSMKKSFKRNVEDVDFKKPAEVSSKSEEADGEDVGGPNTEKSGFTNGLIWEMFSKTKIKFKSFLKIKII